MKITKISECDNNRIEVVGATVEERQAVEFLKSCGTYSISTHYETGEKELFTSAGHQIGQSEVAPRVWSAYEAVQAASPKSMWGYKLIFS